MRRTLSLALAATAVAAATAVPGSSVVAATPDTVRWEPCSEKAASERAASEKAALPPLECSTLEVPLDYRDPDGRQIEIAISRLASKEPSKRRGVLLTNPGGPGITGLGYPAVLAYQGCRRRCWTPTT